MIALPPFAGALHETTIWVFPGVSVVKIGAFGVVRGVADALDEYVPVVAGLSAATLKEYNVPFVSPVTVADVVVVTPSMKFVHVELFVEY